MRKITKFLVSVGLILSISGCANTANDSSRIIRIDPIKLDKAEMNGMKYYRKGDYENAFKQLKEPAMWGYKGSQYVLAFMFLKGQYVEQSTVIGMGWLGVANEVNVNEWRAQFDTFYGASPAPLKAKIDEKVALYIQRYGMKEQNITCNKSLSTSTKRVEVKCQHYEGLGTLYDIEMVE
ncbi:hypothetical protein [Pseudoalteromonas byunsanensis]|uniref:Lipoprotein n=1 Tax=Pseudoalteromonas byunsanensis TaxID=327939 RepID=A0A1S1N9W2_9GAMM|nr:hypothetical protein [Pseudoalteromonas byunsanensis]OHU96468.1 hypothetical protein BIW53_03830 [Pseudoalteromonas byunsanensis]